MKKVLTIAGSDCSGGAGIQADIKTITAHKMYSMSVITALTAQNTLGVTAIEDITPQFVSQQLDAVFTDIFPDAVKIGMVSKSEIIVAIAQKLKEYAAKNIVVDPVMVSATGSKLISDEAKSSLQSLLFPLATVITPNIPETEILCGFAIKNPNDMMKAGKILAEKLGTAVLVKGGHSINDATDYLCVGDKITEFSAERINNTNTHGTGCTLSSAIACNLASGKTLAQSVGAAKEYLTGCLKAQLNLGQGFGPLDHMWNI
jgi:hydroxymethylpyrimidine/phosphomethylpyrimidine kinase